MPTALELGMQALQDGQPTRAASFFEFALKKAPSDPAIRLMAVDAYVGAGMFARAEPHVRYLLDHADALYQRGEYEMLARARSALCQIETGLGKGDVAPGPEGTVGGDGGSVGGSADWAGSPAGSAGPQLRMPGQPASSGPPLRPPPPPGSQTGSLAALQNRAQAAPPVDDPAGDAYMTAPGDPSIVIGPGDRSRQGPGDPGMGLPGDDRHRPEAGPDTIPAVVDLSSASDFATIQSAAAAPFLGNEQQARPRVIACPWCTKTVLLDSLFAGRCQCDWYQPARGSRLYMTDLQRLCADRGAVLLMRVHQDMVMLDGTDVRLRLLGRKSIKVDPRLAFELDLGHAIVFPDQLRPITPQVHPTAVFRLLEAFAPDQVGTESVTEGQFYSFSELVDRLEIEYPDCVGLLPRDIHYQAQLLRHLTPDLRQKADDQLGAGARSYGRCLIAAGMTMEDLLRMVPGWQVLRPVGGGHGRLEGVRSLVRKGFITDEEALTTIGKARGRDSIQTLVEAKLITREVAENVLADLTRQNLQAPLRDDIMERLCRRGVISRVTLVRAGLVLGLVDFDGGTDEGQLAGAMNQIPPEEIEYEKKVLAKKDALRRSERLALGKILVELGFCSRQTVASALARQLREDSPLGEMLVGMLAITPEQLTVALSEQEQRMEALIAPRAVMGSEEPADVAQVEPQSEAEATTAEPSKPESDKESRTEKRASSGSDSSSKKKRSAKSRRDERDENRSRRLLLGGGGLALVAVGVGITLAVMYRPGPRPAATAALPVPLPQATAIDPMGGRRSRIDVPWREPDGRVLDPVSQTEPEEIRKEITRIQIEDPGEHVKLAMLYQVLGDRPRQQAEMEAALRREPKNTRVLVQSAFMRLENGELGESLSLARKGLEGAPDDPFAHIAMGAVWLAGGNDYEAAREFEQAKSLDPRITIEAKVSHSHAPATGGVGVVAPGLFLSVKLDPSKPAGAPPAIRVK